MPAAAVGAAGEGEGRNSRRGRFLRPGGCQTRERQGRRMSEIKLSKSKYVCGCVCVSVCVGSMCKCACDLFIGINSFELVLSLKML